MCMTGVKVRAQLSYPPCPSKNPLAPLSPLPPLSPRVHGLLTWVLGCQVAEVGTQSFGQLRNLDGCQGSLPAATQGCEDAFGRVIHTKGAKSGGRG